LCSVSHCCDNVTRSLSTDVDTGSSTDEYDWEDVTYNTPSPMTTSSNAIAATATVVTAPALASCDVCLNAPCLITFWTCNFLSAMYRHTHCHKFSLSCVSMCHIYYCSVLQLADFVFVPFLCDVVYCRMSV